MSLPKPRARISSLIVGFRSKRATLTKFRYNIDNSASAGRCDCRQIVDRRSFRVDANSQVIKRDFKHVVPDLRRIICVVCQRLHVREQKKLLMIILKLQAIAQRPRVMADMQRTGRPVASKNDGFHWCAFLRKAPHSRVKENKKGRHTAALGYT